MNETIGTILTRRSVRTFDSRQVSDENVDLIVKSGQFAPSARNTQPWHFTVVQNKVLIDSISEAVKRLVLSSGDKAAIARVGDSYHVFHRAPTVIFVSGCDSFYTECDCGTATNNMALAAHSLGLSSCIIASYNRLFRSDNFNSSEYLDALNIPTGYTPIFSLSLGYNSDSDPAAPERIENRINYIK